MAVNRVYLTEAGARVALYCQNNNEAISFTHFGLGDGENLSPKTATAMTSEVVRIPVTMVREVEDGHYRVRAEMSNDAIDENLLFRELCLYCEDPKNMGVEVMYCYGNAKGADFDYTEEIPAFDVSGAYSSRIFDVDVFLNPDLDATFTIDQSGKADIKTVEELRADVDAKADVAMVEGLLADVDAKADVAMVEGLLAGMEHREHEIESPDGYPVWLLFADVTAFYADNDVGKDKVGFTGFVYTHTKEGYLQEDIGRLVATVSYQNVADGNNESTELLRTDFVGVVPCVVSYNGKSYLAIKNTGESHTLHLMGNFQSCLEKDDCILLKNQSADTPPANMAVVSRNWGYFEFSGNSATATVADGLNIKGTNGFTPDTDTMAKWEEKGTCVWMISGEGQLDGQPSNYGLLVNYVNSPDVHQMFLSQPQGSIYHRSGSSEGAGFTAWRKIIDSGNLTAETFTFVVDSDEKLAEWTNNDRTKGQDYTSVLIRKGTWTSAVGVNLTTVGTKVVKGEVGSKLVFNDISPESGRNYSYAMYYDTLPESSEFKMDGVNIECHGAEATSVNSYPVAFFQCVNLTACQGTSFAYGTKQYQASYGFYRCYNMVNCYGRAVGANNGNAYGFVDCRYMENCLCDIRDFTTDRDPKADIIPYSNCYSLSNCVAKAKNGYEITRGFFSCNFLSGCYAELEQETSTTINEIAGFSRCYMVENCWAKITDGSGKSVTKLGGVIDSAMVSHTRSEGAQMYNSIYLNKNNAPSYNTCYADNKKTAVADTSAGGYNFTGVLKYSGGSWVAG